MRIVIFLILAGLAQGQKQLKVDERIKVLAVVAHPTA
jgi:hypothetical protein